jgi:hypothetical protein
MLGGRRTDNHVRVGQLSVIALVLVAGTPGTHRETRGYWRH